MTFGQKLKNLREEKGFSQDNIANMLFVTTQSVIEWENNNAMPSADQIINLSRIFGISVDELLDNTQTGSYVRPVSKAEIVTDKKEINKIFRFKFLNSISVFISVVILVVIMRLMLFCFSNAINTSGSAQTISIFIVFYIAVILTPAIILSIVKYSTRTKAYNQPDGNLLFFNSFITVEHKDGTAYNLPYYAVKKVYELDYYLVLLLSNHRLICIRKKNAEGYIDYVINIFRSQNKYKCCAVTRAGKKPNFTQSSLFTIKALVTGLTVIVIGSIYLSLIIWGFVAVTGNSQKYIHMILSYLPVLIPLAALIFGIVVFCKKVKSKRLIIASSIMLFLTLIYSSIFAIIPTFANMPKFSDLSVSAQDFESEMEEQDFLVDDITSSRTENYLDKCYVAASKTGEYEIYCLEFDKYSPFGNESASDFYNKITNEYKTNKYLYSSSGQSKSLYQKCFIGQSSDDYCVVYLNNTTVIYTCADKEFKDEIQKSLSSYINFYK